MPLSRPGTPLGDMSDMSPIASSPRQQLPTSLASFALNHSSTPSSPQPSTMSLDDPPFPTMLTAAHPLHRKLRRSSLLSFSPRVDLAPFAHDQRQSSSTPGSGGSGSGSRSDSPMNVSWKDRAASPLTHELADEANDADDEDAGSPLITNMAVDSNPVVSRGGSLPMAIPSPRRLSHRRRPSTPPRRTEFPPPAPLLDDDGTPLAKRPTPKPARLLSLLSEAQPQEAEVSSEASFQRLIASHADLPLPPFPRTPRGPRGRFAQVDDLDLDGDMSDDEIPFPDETPMMDDTRWMSASPAGTYGMDVDMSSFGSPSFPNGLASGRTTPNGYPTTSATVVHSMQSYRDVLPPTSTGRAPKRKHTSDDRFEPYGHGHAKRRAVSPSIQLSSSFSNGTPMSSLSSSPHASHPPRSPIMSFAGPRSIHNSPISRPVHRLPLPSTPKEERERAREISGAREGVQRINLGTRRD